jgi:TRAP-type C4-dicarboxylate transport system substrate-binding protein
MSSLKNLCLMAIGLLLSSGMASAQQTVLKYSDHEALGGMRTRFIQDVFFPAIERESNGRLQIEPHWGGELSISYDALRTVSREGVVDMAIVVPEYSPKELPLHQIFKSFPIGPSGSQQVDFFRRVYAGVPALTDELEKTNVVSLLFSTGYPVAFFSTRPLERLEDIQKGTWRTASFWHRDFLNNANAIPVSIPWGDGVYKAMQANTLTGLMVNIDSGYELKVHEVAPNVLVSKDLWLGHLYLLVMNKSTWDNLDEQDQDAIRRAAQIAYKTLGAVMDRSFDTQLEDLRKAGANVRVLDSAEVARWKTATRYQEVQSAWSTEQETKGVENVSATMEAVATILDGY